MRQWTLEGSNDNINYEILHAKESNSDLSSNAIGQYQINPDNKGYKYFRIKQKTDTVSGYSNMRISGIDFFGVYRKTLHECTCKRSKNLYLTNLFYTLVVLS